VSGSVSESVSKRLEMGFGHEKLNVYRKAIEYVGWTYRYREGLKGHRNGKATDADETYYAVREDQARYTVVFDSDSDTDPDTEGNQEQMSHKITISAAAAARLYPTWSGIPAHPVSAMQPCS